MVHLTSPLNLGQRLKCFRRQLGLSQSKLATRLGVTTLTYARWELNRVLPSNLAKRALTDLGFEWPHE